MNGVGVIKSVWQDWIIKTKQVLEFPVENLFFKKTVPEIDKNSEVIDWDEDVPISAEDSYQAMRRALQRTQGFSLFFVRCSPIQADNLINKIKKDLPQKQFNTLTLEKETENLYDLVANLSEKQNTNILFIRGLEHSLLRYEEKESLGLNLPSESKVYGGTWAGIPRILGHLNLSRERFRDSFSIAFVFLLPEFALRYFIRRAPDFFDWRSGVYDFPTEKESVNSEAYRLVYGKDTDLETYRTWTPQRRLQRLTEIRAYLSESPDSERASELWFEKGLIHAVNEQAEEAIASYDQALKIKPDDHSAWNNRGIALDDLGRNEEAIASFDQALKIKPDYHEAWYNRGIALFNLGRYEEAIASYDKALQIKPDKYEAWNNRGNALGNLGRLEEAIASYDNALKVKPNDYGIVNRIGSTLQKMEKYEEAIQWYDQYIDNFNIDLAVENNSDFNLLIINRNSIINKIYSITERINFYQHEIAKSKNKNNPVLEILMLKEISDCLKKDLKDDKTAYKFLFKSWKLAESLRLKISESLFRELQKIYLYPDAFIKLGKLDKANDFIADWLPIFKETNDTNGLNKFVVYEKTIETNLFCNPNNESLNLGRMKEMFAFYDHQAWNNRGAALFNLGKNEEAIASFDKALQVKPDYHQAWNNRGIALRNLGRNEEAIASFDKALQIKPDDHQVWFLRGIALRNLGRNEEAIASFDNALKIKPDDANTYYNKACAYALQEKIDPALENLQQAINLDSQYLEMAKTDTDFDKIRKDSRFIDLINSQNQNLP